jgi:DNA polymerase III subunit epsilon
MTVTEWHRGPIIGFDTETTDSDSETAHIVTASIVLADPGQGKEWARNWLIHPATEISEEAARTHDIKPWIAQTFGKKPDEALTEIQKSFERIRSRYGTIPLAVFNAPFDLTIMNRLTGWEPQFPVVDPLVIDQGMDQYRKGKRQLSAVCEHYGVALEQAHTSQADASATIRLARVITHRFPELQALSLTELIEREQSWHEAWACGYEQFRRERGESSFRVRRAWPYGVRGGGT